MTLIGETELLLACERNWSWRDCFWVGSGGALVSKTHFQMKLRGEAVNSLCVVSSEGLVQGVLWRLHPLLFQLLLQLRQPHVGVLLF